MPNASAMRTKIIDALYPPPACAPCPACGGQVVIGLMDHHLEHQCKSTLQAQSLRGTVADGAKENVDENKKKFDENEKLRVASMQMLEGIVFKLLVSTRQEATTVTWHGSASTTQIVDMVSATLGTNPATRQQVLTSRILTFLSLTLPTARTLGRTRPGPHTPWSSRALTRTPRPARALTRTRHGPHAPWAASEDLLMLPHRSSFASRLSFTRPAAAWRSMRCTYST